MRGHDASEKIWAARFSPTPVTAACRGGFVDDDLREARTLRRELLPKPVGHVLDGRIGETGNFVQVAVIEILEQWPHGLADVRVIIEPTGLGIDLALHAHFHFETVPVHLTAFVPFRRTGQRLRGLEGKVFGQSNSHF